MSFISQRKAEGAVACIIIATVIGFLLPSTVVGEARAKKEINFISHSVFWPLMGKGELLEEFTRETGIKVNYIALGHKELADKVTMEWLAGTGTYDVIGWAGSRFFKKYTQFMEPLSKYLKQAPPEWDFEDIVPSLLNGHTFKGVVYGLPFRTNVWIMYYRKDLYRKYGIEVPKTWDEFLEVAKTLTLDTNGDGKIDIYGIAFFGDPIYARDTSSCFIHGFGGKFVEETPSGELKVVIDNPEAIEGLRFMVDLVRKHKVTPPGIATYNNEDLITAVQQGLTAMTITTGGYVGRVEDPNESKVAGKLGYAPVPTKTNLGYPGMSVRSTWGVTINKFSKNKDAAWEFIKFLTSKRGDLYMALRGNGPSRFSVYQHEKYKARFAEGYTEAISTQLPRTLGLYTILAGPVEWAEITGTICNQLLIGEMSPETAVQKMQEEMSAVME